MTALKKFVGAGFGSGYVPFAPGTIGSFVALFPIYASIFIHPIFGPIALFLLFSVLSLWATDACVDAWGDDPGIMVMDEFAGQSLVFVSLPFSFQLQSDIGLIVLVFLLFRFFDILKPLGINRIQNLPKAWGILMDDVLAGFYALICSKTLIFLFYNFF